MHTARFLDPAGSVRRGRWTDEGLVFAGETYALEEVELLAPCEPSKIVCIGRNYAEHAAERGADVPDRPHLFLKPPSAVAGPYDTITVPAGKERIDPEAELGVIIGQQCRHVDRADAMGVVAGYTCVNDVSNRDDQDREQNWVRGKAFDNAAPLGPVIASPDAVPEDASIELRVNGTTRQEGSLSQLIFQVPELIEEITRYMTLEPGDVISTGTPAGVAPIEDGDVVEVEVEGVGILRNTMRVPS